MVLGTDSRRLASGMRGNSRRDEGREAVTRGRQSGASTAAARRQVRNEALGAARGGLRSQQQG